MPQSLYKRNYWGRLSQFEIPRCIVNDGTLALSPGALTVLLVLLQIARGKQPRNREQWIEVKVGQRLLHERSGLSKNPITAAIRELEASRYLIRANHQRLKRGEFGTNIYLLCNPADGEILLSAGNNFLLGNKIAYFRMPRCIVAESDADWSIAKMTGSQVRLYVAMGWLANKHNDSEFKATEAELKTVTGLSTSKTLVNALVGLVERRLIAVAPSDKKEGLNVLLLDPFTGEPLHKQTAEPEDDPANYYVTPPKGRAKRADLNTGSPEQIESLVLSCLPEHSVVVQQGDGGFKISCPFHAETEPSCSVSPILRCFHCFGCKTNGTITQLLMKLREIGKAEAIRMTAVHLGAEVEFHEPDKNAEAIYDYFDEDGKLLKQVLRYPGKRFSQRRTYKNGWLWNVTKVKPSLYNLHLLEYAPTVCICEGEKDCDSVTNLHLKDCEGAEIVGVTSGGSDSWNDALADDLKGKRVVLMPDDDEPGRQFANEVAASLVNREIDHRTVRFTDVSAKDVSDFLADGHTTKELADRIGADWTMLEVEQELVEA